MTTRTINLDLGDLNGVETITIRLTSGAHAPDSAPSPAVAAMLRRLRTYGNANAVQAFYDGLRDAGYVPDVAHTRKPGDTPPAYLKWASDRGPLGYANTARMEVLPSVGAVSSPTLTASPTGMGQRFCPSGRRTRLGRRSRRSVPCCSDPTLPTKAPAPGARTRGPALRGVPRLGGLSGGRRSELGAPQRCN